MRWAVRGRDIEMKTIFGTFFFSSYKHTAAAVGRGGSGGVIDRERQTRLQIGKKSMSGTGVTQGGGRCVGG